MICVPSAKQWHCFQLLRCFWKSRNENLLVVSEELRRPLISFHRGLRQISPFASLKIKPRLFTRLLNTFYDSSKFKGQRWLEFPCLFESFTQYFQILFIKWRISYFALYLFWFSKNQYITETYLEPSQLSTMELFLQARSIEHVRLGSKYAFVSLWKMA